MKNKELNVNYTIIEEEYKLNNKVQVELNGTILRLTELVAKYKTLFPDYHTRYQDDLLEDPTLHNQIKKNKTMSLEFLND